MDRPNKLNYDTTSRFTEISQQIKDSFALLTQLPNPFQFSQPVEVIAPVLNSNSFGAPNFTFSEPLIQKKVEENVIEELGEKLSTLNIRGTEHESTIEMEFPTIKLEFPIKSSDEVMTSNSAQLDNIVPWLRTIQSSDEILSNHDIRLDNTDPWNSHTSSDGVLSSDGDNTIPWNCSIKSSDELVLNDDIENIRNISDESTVPWIAVKKRSDEVTSVDGFRLDNCTEQNDHYDETTNDGNANRMTSLQMNCFKETDDELPPNDNIPALIARLTGLIEQDADNNGSSNEAHYNGSSFGVDNNKSSNEVGNNETSNVHKEDIPRPNLQIDCNEEQDVDNDMASNNSSENIQTSSVRLNCCVPQASINMDGLLKDINENVPALNIQLTHPKPQEDDNVTQNENSDNYQTDTHRSGDIDPNTQITHLEVDSQKRPPQKLYDSQPLPFLIKHIHKITWPNQEVVVFAPVMQLFGQTFNSVMVYGVVTSLTVEQGGLTQRFVIDDGSGSINVVWKASKQILDLTKTIYQLDEEVKRCRKTGLSVLNENWQPNSEECKKMLDSFDAIIQYIKRHITERTKLKLFGNAGVVGKPFRSREKNCVQLLATLIEDNSRDRSLELYFKKNLIRLYEEKYIYR